MREPLAYPPLLCVVALCLPTFVLAQPAAKEEAKPGDRMIEAYLAAETDKLSQKVLDGAKTLEEWQQRRPRLHREYLYMLGLDPLPAKTPLKATVTGTLESQGVVIDKLHFQSVPGLYVTANLYRPRGNTKKLPTILYVCGHSNKGRDGGKTAFQDHGLWFASNGYNCLIVDTLQLGEIPGVHHGTYGRPYGHLSAYGVKDAKPETRWWWHCRGYTPAGVECWNGVRAIDYLLTRPDVDPGRIGVTGISGGGAATFWIAAADERVKVAVPVSGMSDLQSYVKDKVVNGHCDCMFLYNTYQWEWTTIAALVAPRPLLFANSDNDKIFPMDGNRRIIARLRDLYKLYGKPALVDEYVSAGGHAYRPDLRVAVFTFLNKHLKGDTTTPVKDAEFAEIPGKDLRVFPTDDDLPKDRINEKIDELFVPVAKVELPAEGKFEEWKKDLIGELRDKCFRPIPAQVPPGEQNQESPAFAVKPGSNVFYQVITEQPINLQWLPLSKGKQGTKKLCAIITEPDWSDPRTVPEWMRDWSDDAQAVALFPRGSLFSGWTAKSPPNYVERSHVLLGHTVDQGKLYDVLSYLGLADETFKAYGQQDWGRQLVGRGQSGILAAYAALFEPSIDEVVIVNPPSSHKDGPHFLNVQRVLDVPEALGLLAPRRLTLVGADDGLYNRVAEIYRRAGAADKLTRK